MAGYLAPRPAGREGGTGRPVRARSAGDRRTCVFEAARCEWPPPGQAGGDKSQPSLIVVCQSGALGSSVTSAYIAALRQACMRAIRIWKTVSATAASVVYDNPVYPPLILQNHLGSLSIQRIMGDRQTLPRRMFIGLAVALPWTEGGATTLAKIGQARNARKPG